VFKQPDLPRAPPELFGQKACQAVYRCFGSARRFNLDCLPKVIEHGRKFSSAVVQQRFLIHRFFSSRAAASLGRISLKSDCG
jgi:hypothetical protein